jgi:hypothetical protein
MTQPAWNPHAPHAPTAQSYAHAHVNGHSPQQAAAELGRSVAAALPGGFVAGLFDFSFRTFVATKVLKFLYGLWLAALVLGVIGGAFNAVYTMFFGYRMKIAEGLLMLAILPFAATAWLILGRVYFEAAVALFRIAENLTEMNQKMR